MAKGVVHLLEAVEIEAEQGEVPAPGEPGDGGIRAFPKG